MIKSVYLLQEYLHVYIFPSELELLLLTVSSGKQCPLVPFLFSPVMLVSIHPPAVHVFYVFNEESSLVFALVHTRSYFVFVFVNDVTFAILLVSLQINSIFQCPDVSSLQSQDSLWDLRCHCASDLETSESSVHPQCGQIL